MSLSSTSKNEPLVSIVVPVYNGGEYFEACLESILNQTYQNWECIINNNCSEDNTMETAMKYANKDKRFKLFSNETFVRMTPNWNIACSKISTSSKYLRVFGADDWLFPESIEKMVALMEKFPSIGICSSYRLNDRMVDMDGLNIWDGNVFNGKELLYNNFVILLTSPDPILRLCFQLNTLRKYHDILLYLMNRPIMKTPN